MGVGWDILEKSCRYTGDVMGVYWEYNEDTMELRLYNYITSIQLATVKYQPVSINQWKSSKDQSYLGMGVMISMIQYDVTYDTQQNFDTWRVLETKREKQLGMK